MPQIPLDAIPAVAPQVSYQGGQLTIIAPNSTLGDILRGVRKHTSADIEIPPTASERVVTRLGPGPAREVMAELLNGSHFNYILLGSPDDANLLVRVVLVAKDSGHANATSGSEQQHRLRLQSQPTPPRMRPMPPTQTMMPAMTPPTAQPNRTTGGSRGAAWSKNSAANVARNAATAIAGAATAWATANLPSRPGGALPPGQTPAQPDQQ